MGVDTTALAFTAKRRMRFANHKLNFNTKMKHIGPLARFGRRLFYLRLIVVVAMISTAVGQTGSPDRLQIPPLPLQGETFLSQTVAHFGGSECSIYGVYGALIEGLDGWLYGTASGEGAPSGPGALGVVFRIAKDGSVCEILHTFGTSAEDGYQPYAELVDGHDGFLYGTTLSGGATSAGTAFRLPSGPAGGGYQKIIDFQFIAGGQPWGGLVLGGDGFLYGTGVSGGTGGGGFVFRLEPDASSATGWSAHVLHEFPDPDRTGLNQPYHPAGTLELGRDGFLYGTLAYGGGTLPYGGGVFRLSTDGLLYESLYTATGTPGSAALLFDHLLQAQDGAFYGFSNLNAPTSPGALNYGALYRTSFEGGTWQTRSIHMAGSGDPAAPAHNMHIIEGPDGRLYGTGKNGGAGFGGVFVCGRDGSGFNSILQFLNHDPAPGRWPQAGLLAASDGWFYGTTSTGGRGGGGTLFRLKPNNLELGVGVDVVSITQGADFDASTSGAPPVEYGLLSSKSTLVRVQPFTLRPPSPIVSAALSVEKVGERTRVLFDPVGIPSGPIAGYPVGTFLGAPALDFWLPGSAFPTVGDYRLTLLIKLADLPLVTHAVLLDRTGRVPFGSPLYFGIGPHLSVLLFPGSSQNASPPSGNAMPWTSGHASSLLAAVSEWGRLLPVREGLRGSVGSVRDVDAVEGVHYRVHPGVFSASAGDSRDTWRASFRLYMANVLAAENAALARLHVADRFDLGIGLEAAVTNSWADFHPIRSGQPSTILAEFDSGSRDTSPSLVLREIAHALGQGDSAAINLLMPEGRKMVNLATRANVPRLQSVMNRTAPFIASPQAALPGATWNALRLALSRRHPSDPPVWTARLQAQGPDRKSVV